MVVERSGGGVGQKTRLLLFAMKRSLVGGILVRETAREEAKQKGERKQCCKKMGEVRRKKNLNRNVSED